MMQQTSARDGIPQALLKTARQNGHLKLANRELMELPESTWKLHKEVTENERWWENVDLKAVDLTNNGLELIPEEAFQGDEESAWLTVASLRLTNNRLTTLPEGIGNLHFLRSVYVEK